MRLLQAFVLIPLLLLVSCSGGTPNSSNNSNYTGPYVYLVSGATGNWQVSSYPASGTGNPTATNTTTASTDSNVSALELSSDGNGNLYTMTDMPAGTGYTVSEYSQTHGVLALERAFTILAGQIGSLVADRSGVVYTAQGSYVISFAANASGTVTYTQSYLVAGSGSVVGLAEDTSGDMYVGLSTSGGSPLIEEFPAGFSSLTPIKTINLGQYLSSLVSLAVDSNGTLYAAGTATLGFAGSNSSSQADAVAAFDNGSLSPTRTLSSAYGSNIIGARLNSLMVDSNNLLYVYSYLCPYSCNNTVSVFSATDTGDVAPLNYFQTAGPIPLLQSMVVH